LTDIISATSSLVLDEGQPLLDICLSEDSRCLWVTNSKNGEIHNYRLDGERFQLRDFDEQQLVSLCTSPMSPAGSNHLGSGLKKGKRTLELEPQAVNQSLCAGPSLVFPARAGVVKYHVLNDRIRVLTMNSRNQLQLWDVLRCCKLQDLPPDSDWEQVIKDFSQIIHVPNWFSVDTTTGVSLIII
jgi:hypothetical protein